MAQSQPNTAYWRLMTTAIALALVGVCFYAHDYVSKLEDRIAALEHEKFFALKERMTVIEVSNAGLREEAAQIAKAQFNDLASGGVIEKLRVRTLEVVDVSGRVRGQLAGSIENNEDVAALSLMDGSGETQAAIWSDSMAGGLSTRGRVEIYDTPKTFTRIQPSGLRVFSNEVGVAGVVHDAEIAGGALYANKMSGGDYLILASGNRGTAFEIRASDGPKLQFVHRNGRVAVWTDETRLARAWGLAGNAATGGWLYNLFRRRRGR